MKINGQHLPVPSRYGHEELYEELLERQADAEYKTEQEKAAARREYLNALLSESGIAEFFEANKRDGETPMSPDEYVHLGDQELRNYFSRDPDAVEWRTIRGVPDPWTNERLKKVHDSLVSESGKRYKDYDGLLNPFVRDALGWDDRIYGPDVSFRKHDESGKLTPEHVAFANHRLLQELHPELIDEWKAVRSPYPGTYWLENKLQEGLGTIPALAFSAMPFFDLPEWIDHNITDSDYVWDYGDDSGRGRVQKFYDNREKFGLTRRPQDDWRNSHPSEQHREFEGTGLPETLLYPEGIFAGAIGAPATAALAKRGLGSPRRLADKTLEAQRKAAYPAGTDDRNPSDAQYILENMRWDNRNNRWSPKLSAGLGRPADVADPTRRALLQGMGALGLAGAAASPVAKAVSSALTPGKTFDPAVLDLVKDLDRDQMLELITSARKDSGWMLPGPRQDVQDMSLFNAPDDILSRPWADSWQSVENRNFDLLDPLLRDSPADRAVWMAPLEAGSDDVMDNYELLDMYDLSEHFGDDIVMDTKEVVDEVASRGGGYEDFFETDPVGRELDPSLTSDVFRPFLVRHDNTPFSYRHSFMSPISHRELGPQGYLDEATKFMDRYKNKPILGDDLVVDDKLIDDFLESLDWGNLNKLMPNSHPLIQKRYGELRDLLSGPDARLWAREGLEDEAARMSAEAASARARRIEDFEERLPEARTTAKFLDETEANLATDIDAFRKMLEGIPSAFGEGRTMWDDYEWGFLDTGNLQNPAWKDVGAHRTGVTPGEIKAWNNLYPDNPISLGEVEKLIEQRDAIDSSIDDYINEEFTQAQGPRENPALYPSAEYIKLRKERLASPEVKSWRKAKDALFEIRRNERILDVYQKAVDRYGQLSPEYMKKFHSGGENTPKEIARANEFRQFMLDEIATLTDRHTASMDRNLVHSIMHSGPKNFIKHIEELKGKL